jgi:hypothetical protein
MATNEGKSDLFYMSGLNSFKNGLLLVRSAHGADYSDRPVIVHKFHRIFEEKTGALFGSGGRLVQLQRGRSNDISTKKFFANGSP